MKHQQLIHAGKHTEGEKPVGTTESKNDNKNSWFTLQTNISH